MGIGINTNLITKEYAKRMVQARRYCDPAWTAAALARVCSHLFDWHDGPDHTRVPDFGWLELGPEVQEKADEHYLEISQRSPQDLDLWSALDIAAKDANLWELTEQ